MPQTETTTEDEEVDSYQVLLHFLHLLVELKVINLGAFYDEQGSYPAYSLRRDFANRFGPKL